MVVDTDQVHAGVWIELTRDWSETWAASRTCRWSRGLFKRDSIVGPITHTTTRCRHDSISSYGHRYAGPQHLTQASPRCCNPSCAAHNSPPNRETPRFFHRSRTTRAPTTRRSEEEEVLRPARARHQDVVTRVRRPTERSRATSMVVKRLRRSCMVSEVSRTSAFCFSLLLQEHILDTKADM